MSALIKISETTISSATSSVVLTGIDSTFDVYFYQAIDVMPDTDTVAVNLRFTESGTANSTANYDEGFIRMRSGNTFQNKTSTNATSFLSLEGVGNQTNENFNLNMVIYNADQSNGYTFMIFEDIFRISSGSAFQPSAGGGVFTVTSAVDGVSMAMSSGDVASGTFKLYGLVK